MNPGQFRDLMSKLVTIFIALSLGACGMAQAEVPAPTRTLTPTPSPTPTATPTPTVTSTPAPRAACPLPNLWYDQQISASGSYTETQTEAAGAMLCHIEPGTCAFYLLVGELDPTIVFKREEEPPYDREDILMHPSMLLPLWRLNQLVTAEWGGEVRLRVTDAYDSLLEHDLSQVDESRNSSLHFEGRAIDLTTWPIEPGRYGRLCSLAHCAGFD